MASDRQKRKRRQASREGAVKGGVANGDRYARSRAKDDAARAKLEPLKTGERPTAVTVGAIVALILGGANLLLYVAGVEIQGEKPKFIAVLFPTTLMLVCAWGMWKARYWAVLGMQVVLGFTMIFFAVVATAAGNFAAIAISLAMVAASGTLFWFLIKAMARIQMPERP